MEAAHVALPKSANNAGWRGVYEREERKDYAGEKMGWRTRQWRQHEWGAQGSPCVTPPSPGFMRQEGGSQHIGRCYISTLSSKRRHQCVGLTCGLCHRNVSDRLSDRHRHTDRQSDRQSDTLLLKKIGGRAGFFLLQTRCPDLFFSNKSGAPSGLHRKWLKYIDSIFK